MAIEKDHTVCMKCKWHGWTRGEDYGLSHACRYRKFSRTDYITGNTLPADCFVHNSEGDCQGFEERPPDAPKVGWFKRLFGSVPGPGIRDG